LYRIVVTSAWLVAAAPAAAGRLDDGYGSDPTRPLGYAFEKVAPTPDREASPSHEVNVRLRSVSVPRVVLDNWYNDETDPQYAYVEPRPHLSGVGMGFEFVLKGAHHNGIFYGEYVDSRMPAGYFDDLDEDLLDGDYVVPSDGFGLVGAGANYAYEAPIVRSADTGGRFQLGYLIGGGLGVAVLVGELDRWGADSFGNPGYMRFATGEAADEGRKLSRVYPLVDVNTGLRFTFGDRFVVRAEGGLHSALYFGATAGVMF
jgi:hypothetical protein